MTLMLLLVLLHSTGETAAAIPGKYLSLTVREGHDVTLPCEKMMWRRFSCYRTSWMYSSPSDATELVSFGRITENNKFKLGRLRLTENCSLVVQAVTADDGGVYSCIDSSLGELHNTDVEVLVVTMAEYSGVQRVTFNCTVTTPGQCRHRIRWLYEGQAFGQAFGHCSSTVTIKHAELRWMSKRHDALQCEVSDIHVRKTQLFSFSSSFGEHATTTATPTMWPSSPSPTTQDGCSAVDFIMLALRVAELGLITVITVLLVRARGKQRRPDERTVHGDDTVSYENVRESAGSVRLNTNSQKK